MNIMGSGLKCRPPHERERAWQECTVSEVILPNLLALVGEVEGKAFVIWPAGRAGWRVNWHEGERRSPVLIWRRTCWRSHDALKSRSRWELCMFKETPGVLIG